MLFNNFTKKCDGGKKSKLCGLRSSWISPFLTPRRRSGGFPLKKTPVGCPKRSKSFDFDRRRDLIALYNNSPHCNPFFAVFSREDFLNEYKYIIASFANTISICDNKTFPGASAQNIFCLIRYPPYSLQGRLLYPQRLKKIIVFYQIYAPQNRFNL